jgi:hypothetical protein
MPDVDCVDDPAIANTENLWRYFGKVGIVRDRITGHLRPMSGMLIDDRMSVDIASQTTLAQGKTRNPDKWPLQFAVAAVRTFGKCVTQKLDPDPDNPAHAVVCPKMSKAEARTLASQSEWAEAPPNDLKALA